MRKLERWLITFVGVSAEFKPTRNMLPLTLTSPWQQYADKERIYKLALFCFFIYIWYFPENIDQHNSWKLMHQRSFRVIICRLHDSNPAAYCNFIVKSGNVVEIYVTHGKVKLAMLSVWARVTANYVWPHVACHQEAVITADDPVTTRCCQRRSSHCNVSDAQDGQAVVLDPGPPRIMWLILLDSTLYIKTKNKI